MDERVKKALQQWPNVPDIYGWLSLDRRGQWLLQGESISNRNLVDFINRNYERLESGSYAFQNGPQRVHVDLEITPYVVDLVSEDSITLALHTGVAVESLSAAYLDSNGQLILMTDSGPALLRDQALPRLLACFTSATGQPLNDADLEAALQNPSAAGLSLRVPGLPAVAVDILDADAMEPELDFIRHPHRNDAPAG